jgi:hypothetical protein
VLVLHPNQLRDQDQVPVAVSATQVWTRKACRDSQALALQGQEGSRVRADSRIAGRADPFFRGLRRQALGACALEGGHHLRLEL